MEPRAPLDVFTAECCSRCVNPECTRSNFGNSKFEARISTWYERLFSDVPRMLPEDGRFGKIAGQKFLLIDPDGAVTSSWVDPRDLEVPTRVVMPRLPEAPSEPPKMAGALELPPPPVPLDTPAVEPVQIQDHLVPAAPAASSLAFANTPAKSGQMLGNRLHPKAQDWQSPGAAEPPSSAEVVKTGAKIRIGS